MNMAFAAIPIAAPPPQMVQQQQQQQLLQQKRAPEPDDDQGPKKKARSTKAKRPEPAGQSCFRKSKPELDALILSDQLPLAEDTIRRSAVMLPRSPLKMVRIRAVLLSSGGDGSPFPLF